MIKDKTKFLRIGSSVYVRIPKSLINDSRFPMKLSGKLDIEIINKKGVLIKND